ncbi:MAG: PIN domain-containing protein [Dehalococcoidia bacterium]|nr:PIN domain-containing protein [Dehalococcoidia bacterium]
MLTYYLDTSALMKRYRTELGTEAVRELVGNRSPEDVFVTSQITTLEVEAAAARALRGRMLEQEAYDVLLGWSAQDVGRVFALYPVTGETIRKAIDVTRTHGLRAGDAVHVATALEFTGSRSVVVLVTSDKELLTVVARERWLVGLDPQGPDAIEQIRILR